MGFRVVGRQLILDGSVVADFPASVSDKKIAWVKKHVEWDLNGKKKPPKDVAEVEAELKRRLTANGGDPERRH